ncbi:MAG: NAD-dependent epimerase/dehydratase family protein [Usitatibacter sp.]
MRVLVLGGTIFLGKAVTDVLLARGHQVTHFNRGKSRPPDTRVETLPGDRTDAAAMGRAFSGRLWDAVVDTSGYLPQVVRLSAASLRDKASRYFLVSSVSAYADLSAPGYDEGSPLLTTPDPLPEALAPEFYGPLKAGCERVINETWGEHATIVRPGLIVGPNDPTDRFTYWPARIARGGTVVAPGDPARRVQVIDVRDLALWMVTVLERDLPGVYNAAGPVQPLTMNGLLQGCLMVTPGATLQWVPDGRLLEHKVAPWSEMPLWLPSSDSMNSLMAANIDRAVAAGLRFRPLAQTIVDTLAWANGRPADHRWKAGLSAERESELLGS